MILPVLTLGQALNFTEQLAAQSGDWPVSLSQLVPVAVLSVVFGFLLARSHYSELTSLVLSTIYAVGTILLVQFFAAPGDIMQRIYAVLSRLLIAIEAGGQSGLGFDPYLLVMFLSLLVWFLGHNTAWHTFRLDRVWRAILPPGIVLVLNSIYNTTPNTSFDLYVMAYIFLALLLVIRSHIEAREFDWYMNRIVFRGNVRRWFFRIGALLIVIMLCLAWILPTGSAEQNAKRFQEFLNEDTLARIAEFLNKLFGSLEGQGAASADYYGADKLTLGGAIQLGENPVMVIDAPSVPRYYWKSRIFDTYENGEWTANRGNAVTDPNALTLSYPVTDPQARRDVEQHFLMIMGASRLVYAAPQPRLIQVGARAEVDFLGNGQMDVGIVRPLEPLLRDQTYTAISSISTATDEFLRATTTNYPDWVQRYKQLPGSVTARTRQLALQIAGDLPTVYDKAKALEQWLRQNIEYNENIQDPPVNQDLVDWVLFDYQQGYCTYYASAMIVMLRTLGIPARMAAGFAQGSIQTDNGEVREYLVRERDAHTWVEVYFPGAGWVEFEPTSAQQPITRGQQQVAAPTSTPTATFTPTAAPMPTITAIVTQPGQQPPLLMPSTTPTAAPLPTQTPTATPKDDTLPSLLELPPQAQSFLGGLLLAAAIVAVLSFGLIGLLWYVDYRGWDRLSPIGRAYARLNHYAQWIGLQFREGSTPLERGRRIAREVPKEGKPVIEITDTYISERYAPPRASAIDDEKQAESAWRRARRGLFGRKVRQWLGRKPRA